MINRLFFAVLALLPGQLSAETIFPGYEWRDLGDGVYTHIRQDPFAGPVDGNSVIIINESDVFVVDTHINPAAARAVVEKIKSLTGNPVSTIINTHWHDDHTNGNASFVDAFPEVEIISHSYTAEKLSEEWEAFEESRSQSYGAVTVEQILEAADKAEADNPDRAISLRIYAGYVEALKPELADMKFAYPDKMIDSQAVFERGGREIIVLAPGAGNTQGDLVVWLPNEKTLITGDIVVAPIPYAFDSPMLEWTDTIERLKEYDADVIIPGHGKVLSGNGYLDKLAGLIRETVNAVSQAAEQDASYENLSEDVNLDEQRDAFTDNDPIALNAWRSYYFTPALKSAWIALGFPVPDETP